MPYTAVVIDDDSRRALVNAFESMIQKTDFSGFSYSTKMGGYLPHHMTINLGHPDPKLNFDILGKDVQLKVDGFSYDKNLGVAAARVSDTGGIKTMNKQPHITMCLLPNGKPVNSNQLGWQYGNWLPVTPFAVNGQVKICE